MNTALTCAALAALVGHEVELLPLQRSGHWLVVPADRSRLAEPFWQTVKASAPVTDWKTAEAAVVGFATGVAGWVRAAAQMPTSDLDEALRERLAAGPVAVAVLWREFGAIGISRDRIDRAARRLGVERRKAGVDGGWWWQLPKAACLPSEDSASDLRQDGMSTAEAQP